MMGDRYYLDERVGCVAVRDHTLDLPDEDGLHPNTEGVVKFWMGEKKVPDMHHCPLCMRYHEIAGIGMNWTVSEETIKEATKFCEDLNNKEENP
jgi:hypothetical protein